MELLVRIVDKVNPDFYLNLGCSKRGDVIVVKPDGWAWGSDELSNPQWRILQVPNLTLEEAEALAAPEVLQAGNSKETLQKRGFKLDLDSPALQSRPGFQTFLTDHARTTRVFTFPGNSGRTLILGAKQQKSPVADPRAAIGNNPRVIG